jgi:signal transduction histidine kinase
MNQDTVESLQAELLRCRQEQQTVERHLQGLRAVLRRLYVAHEAQCTSLSRHLHDETSQALTGLKMDLAWLQNCLGHEDGAIREKTKAMSLLVDEAVHSLRYVMGELRPSILDDFGLAAAVEWQLQNFQSRTGIRCHMQLPSGEPQLDAAVASVLFRVFRELLDNLYRHAYASRVEVRISRQAGELLFQVKDNGRGITEQEIKASDSLGLISMQEQLFAIGAQVHFAGTPGKGTVATIRLRETP